MQILRSILYIDPSGCRLSDEYGSDTGVKMEMMLGAAVRLEFDLRQQNKSGNAELAILPPEPLSSAVEYYFALDSGTANSAVPKFLRTSGITLEVDDENKTVFTVELPNCATDELKEFLSGRECAVMRAEIGGVDTQMQTVFAWQFDITLRSRVYLGGGDESVAADPAYYTAVQVEAALSRQLFYEYSADGENWHDELTAGDIYFRVRHGETGVASEIQKIPYGGKGDKGDTGDKGDKGDKGDAGDAGARGQFRYPVTACFGNETYQIVCYLDAAHGMTLAGYIAEPVNKIDLYVVSANPEYTGNIVLNVGAESFTVPVGSTVGKVTLNLTVPATGIVSIVRDTADAGDTLSDGTDAITAYVVDWSVQ